MINYVRSTRSGAWAKFGMGVALTMLLIPPAVRSADAVSDPTSSRAAQTAQTASDAPGQPPPPAAAAVAPSPAATQGGEPLKASAQMIKATVAIRGIGEAADKIKHTSLDMIGELERWNLLWGHPAQDQSGNMLWGGGFTKEEVLEQYRKFPTTVFTTPEYVELYSYRLAPRKKWLAMYLRQIGQLINLMQAEINDAAIPPEKQSAVADLWSQVEAIAKDVEKNYMTAYNLVESTDDQKLNQSVRQDQVTIGAPIVAIHDDVDKLHKVLQDLYKVVRD